MVWKKQAKINHKKIKDLSWCTNCVMMSTRPRMTFNEDGLCNACQWSFEKNKKINWSVRKKELLKLLKKHKKTNGQFDCLVPCSGGKDGSYVAYNLKHKYKMNPLCITVNPPLRTEIGKKNLESFVRSGYELISIDCNYDAMREFNRVSFLNMGSPYLGWWTACQTAVTKIAIQLGINLIFYGEDGEIEYGGSKETIKSPIYDFEYQKRIYLEGGYDKIMNTLKIDKKNLNFFKFPIKQKSKSLQITHWSYFENWDQYRNYVIAKKYCGLQESVSVNSGTFTNFAQNDQALYALHTYLMFLKFGFGRASQDSCIEVRRGAMDRNQAKNLINLYDESFPEQFLEIYLHYFKMNKRQFFNVLDKFANKNILKKVNGFWKKNFEIK